MNKYHVLIIIIIVALQYLGWAICHINTLNKRRMQDDDRYKPPDDDIMGKSHFVLPERYSKPQAATDAQTVEAKENPDIFAAETVPQHPRQIPTDQLDEVFGEAPEGEDNEPLEIDVPLYDTPFPEDGDDEPDWNEELDDDEYRPVRANSYAQGATYEQLGEVYRRVVQENPLTEDQKQETGRILHSLRGTDVFNTISSGHREEKVKNLIESHLSALNHAAAGNSVESPSPQGHLPDDFNVEQFV